MRILLVEDDEKIASFIIKGLTQESFAVDYASEGAAGLQFVLNGSYDAAIVDLMLPKLDGLSLIEEVRTRKINTPVIILSAKHSVDDRIKGLQAGGDDYLVKPFSFSELLARIKALIRRALAADIATVYSSEDLSINILTREVFRAEKKISLQAREFALLEFLMRNKGRVVSKKMIIDNILKLDFTPQTNLVDVLVCRLRNKVDKDYSRKVIRTVRGVGYLLESD